MDFFSIIVLWLSWGGIFIQYCTTNSSSPEVELRFCQWIILYKYWTGRPDLSSFLCPYYSMRMHCIEGRCLWSASGDRTSGYIHGLRMTKNSVSGAGATSLSPIQQQKFHHRWDVLSILKTCVNERIKGIPKGPVRLDWIYMRVVPLDRPWKGHQL